VKPGSYNNIHKKIANPAKAIEKIANKKLMKNNNFLGEVVVRECNGYVNCCVNLSK
jgi:hypothetical protein